MTLRSRINRSTIRSIVLAGALAAGGIAAVPAAVGSAAAQAPVIRNDPFAPEASAALVDLTTAVANDNQAARAEYDSERDALAADVAGRLGLDPVAMAAAWRAADLPHQAALMAALSQLGVPYHRNTSIEGVGFDCSGLTTWAWAQAGVTLVRQSGAQIRDAAPRTAATAQAGDLVYYPGHAMMYLGVANAIVHAPQTGRTVEVTFITKSRTRSVRYGDPTA